MKYVLEINKPEGTDEKAKASRMKNRDGLIGELKGYFEKGAGLRYIEKDEGNPTLTIECSDSVAESLQRKLPKVTFRYDVMDAG